MKDLRALARDRFQKQVFKNLFLPGSLFELALFRLKRPGGVPSEKLREAKRRQGQKDRRKTSKNCAAYQCVVCFLEMSHKQWAALPRATTTQRRELQREIDGPFGTVVRGDVQQEDEEMEEVEFFSSVLSCASILNKACVQRSGCEPCIFPDRCSVHTCLAITRQRWVVL